MSLPKPHEQSFCYRSICFIGLELKLSVMRLYFCLVLPLLRASGKDKTMKRIPKTPIEFDYDLWTTEDGKFMVRVKLTGEVTEVNHDVMRILRAEEKRLRRSLASAVGEDETNTMPTVMSYDALPDDDVRESVWLADPASIESDVLTDIFIEEFCRELVHTQAAFFKECLINGKSFKDFSEEYGVERTTLWRWQKQIREKIQKYF